MDEEKLKLYYIVEHQAKMIKMQAKTIDALTLGIWTMFCIFILFALVNIALSFYEKITRTFTQLWSKVWSRKN